jgi:putative membrane protein
MGRFFIRTISTSLAVLLAGYLLKGVEISNTVTAIIVALLLGLLNTFVKPILVFLTIPITLLTLGFFLLVINVIIILIVDDLVAGFAINTWLTAFFFSLIVSFTASLIEKLIGVPREKEEE